MINFDSVHFDILWNHPTEFINKGYNVGRGQKSKVFGKDAPFLTLTVLKHGGEWDVLARVFKMKGPTFERLVTKFVCLISSFPYESFVTEFGKLHSMALLRDDGKHFSTFEEGHYATDVTFQQGFRPGSKIEEEKRYFSVEYKLYGYNVEVSVLPNGLALGSSQHYHGSVSDFESFQGMRNWHLTGLGRIGKIAASIISGF
ncbi:hypothetical protein BWQ96_09415 [Gracilariopsis chorda]|uniref:Uncharacterized protein n=1 Tax=Gracilariopsis chorda TaxID=448386 RepID=A0A2V3II99_9FLOR|nr:hypothetical protein BWQ96_09415 [Gracilariopsis chorda]|eukprot:PXF40870.1 hypothetical protein BWQ96_09415 [Gracilariopsis chorda]